MARNEHRDRPVWRLRHEAIMSITLNRNAVAVSQVAPFAQNAPLPRHPICDLPDRSVLTGPLSLDL